MKKLLTPIHEEWLEYMHDQAEDICTDNPRYLELRTSSRAVYWGDDGEYVLTPMGAFMYILDKNECKNVFTWTDTQILDSYYYRNFYGKYKREIGRGDGSWGQLMSPQTRREYNFARQLPNELRMPLTSSQLKKLVMEITRTPTDFLHFGVE